jgi:hypothetical protein
MAIGCIAPPLISVNYIVLVIQKFCTIKIHQAFAVPLNTLQEALALCEQ